MTANTEIRNEFKRRIGPLVPPLAQIARYMLGDSATAEELLQDKVIEAYRAYVGDMDDDTFRLWLFTRVMDAISERCHVWSSSAPHRRVNFDDRFVAGRMDEAAASRLFRRRLRAEIGARELVEVIRLIPFHLRAVLVLWLIGRFTPKEITAVLGVPERTVRIRLNEGRRLLRMALCERMLGAFQAPREMLSGAEGRLREH